MIIVTDVAPVTGCDVLACGPRRSALQSGREMAPRDFLLVATTANTDKAGLLVEELSDSCLRIASKHILCFIEKVRSRPHLGSC